MTLQDVEIVRVETQAHIKQFLQLPYDLYRDEPHWRAPLRFERSAQLSPDKNPGAKHLTRQLFLARRKGENVGRIAAFLNPDHRELYRDNAGHFGYWDCEANPATGAALMKAAEDWLEGQGVSKIIGPASWSVNEECGLLVDGFDTPPVLMMGFGRPDYQVMIEAAGFEKAIDLYAYMAALHEGYPRPKTTTRMVSAAENDPAVTVRSLNMKDFKNEVALVMGIFNDAWSENWGFVPFSDHHIAHMAAEMKPLIFKEGLKIGYIDGKPAAFIWMVPDLYAAIKGLDGKLLPFGWATLIKRLKITGVKTARIPLMGLRKEYQHSRQGLALIAKLCEDVFESGRNKGFTHCELSWILETNKSMIRICEQASAKRYKTYRMYEKAL